MSERQHHTFEAPKRQHGHTFEPPVCRKHGKPLHLDRRVRQGWDQQVEVDYEWYCGNYFSDLYEHLSDYCVVSATKAGEYAVPQEILDSYKDPAPHFVGGKDTTLYMEF